MELLGERIRRLRLARGYSLSELGSYIGKSKVTIYWWEAGAHVPLAHHVRSLARGLGVTTDYLLTGREAPRLAALERAIRARTPYDRLVLMLPPETKPARQLT